MTTQPAVPNDASLPVTLCHDDARLIEQCLRGDEAAWAALLSKYKNLIFSIPIKYGFSREESADIFQSVCLDLLYGLRRLQEPRALAAWLIRITYRRCFHQRQVDHRYPTVNASLDSVVATDEIPESRLYEVQREQALRTALRSLNPRCYRLVEMLFFESPARPYDDVAKSLTMAKGSIGPIRRRCLDDLRKALEEDGFCE